MAQEEVYASEIEGQKNFHTEAMEWGIQDLHLQMINVNQREGRSCIVIKEPHMRARDLKG